MNWNMLACCSSVTRQSKAEIDKAILQAAVAAELARNVPAPQKQVISNGVYTGELKQGELLSAAVVYTRVV